MNNQYAFGHAWNGDKSAFVSYELATHKETTTYNLCDFSGDHARNTKHYKAQSEETRAMIDTMIADARKDLRANLDYMLARKRDTPFEHLQYCYMVTKGYGGVTWHIDQESNSHATIQGYDIDDSELAEIMRLGIPYVDITTIPHEDCITPSLSGPMPPSKPERADNAPYNSLSYAPLVVYCNFWRMLGADVRNIEAVELNPALFSNPKIQALLMKA